ncbi:hypothetical protein Ciccas_010673, partial [Cichlidogyrus casuarinus]
FDQGILVYSTAIASQTGAKTLSFDYARDEVNVFGSRADLTGIKFLGSFDTNTVEKKLKIQLDSSLELLHICVENQGRINYGPMQGDYKGLKKQVKLDDKLLQNFSIQKLDLNNMIPVQSPSDQSIFAVYSQETNILEEVNTHVTVQRKGRGFIVINGKILGRFDTKLGPQTSLYAPPNFWQMGRNTVNVIFTRQDQDVSVDRVQVKFTDQPIWM